MADNIIYISAGIIANETGEAESSNQMFIASGLIPDDTGAEPPTLGIPIAMYHYQHH